MNATGFKAVHSVQRTVMGEVIKHICTPPFATILWFNVYYFHYMFRPLSVTILKVIHKYKIFLESYFIFNGSVDLSCIRQMP
jgi:hypothetical protein